MPRDGFLTCTQLAKAIAENGRKSHASTVWRWMKIGARIGSGRPIRLRFIKQGRTLLTRLDWYYDWMNEVGEANRNLLELGDRTEQPHISREPNSHVGTAQQQASAQNQADEAGW